MEIEEFKKLKNQVEGELTSAISVIINKFEDRTGFSPNNVNVHMIKIQIMGQRNPKYIVENVSIDVEI